MSYKIDKPWGHELVWAHEPFYAAKIIYIKKGCRLSLQKHMRKFEDIYILSGLMRLHVLEHGESEIKVIPMTPGDTYHISPGMAHRFEAVEDTELVEVSTTDLDDAERLEDDYGRV